MTEAKPRVAAVTVAGVTSFLVAAASLTMIAAVPLFTMFGAQFFPDRWLVTFACGVVPAAVAVPAFLVGLRRHDGDDERGAIRAFLLSLVCIPPLLAGGAYLFGA